MLTEDTTCSTAWQPNMAAPLMSRRTRQVEPLLVDVGALNDVLQAHQVVESNDEAATGGRAEQRPARRQRRRPTRVWPWPSGSLQNAHMSAVVAYAAQRE